MADSADERLIAIKDGHDLPLAERHGNGFGYQVLQKVEVYVELCTSYSEWMIMKGGSVDRGRGKR